MTWDAAALQQHRPAVLAFLTRRVWNREAAEDLCQETFLRALRARTGLRDVSRLRSYLLRIAQNLAIDHLRRRDPATPVTAGDPDTLADHRSQDPATRYESTDLAQRIENLLDELPHELRIAFEQGVLERRPYAEIAQAEGWSLAKVKINVYRARRRLMAGLDETGAPRARAGAAGR